MPLPAPEATLAAVASPRRLTVPSPLGPLTLEERDGAIAALSWDAAAAPGPSPLLSEAAAQLAAYFAGRLRSFDLPLAPAGAAFETRAWDALRDIPYGATSSYGALARRLGTGARAVGRACGANPIPILIPCHRVIAADGGLGGYSGRGGLATKAALLGLEGGSAAV